MGTFLIKILALSLLATNFVNAQSAGQTAGATTVKAVATTPATPKAPAATPAAIVDELVGLLPASDLVAVVDVGRAFNDLLPRLANLTVGGLDKMAKEVQEFTAKTGIDPAKVQSAVLGFSMNGAQANGAIILAGLDLDDKKIEAAIKSYNAEFKTTEYKGKLIYNLITKVKSPSAGPVSVKTDETAFVSLSSQRLALGDLSALKNVIDISTGAAKGGVTPALLGALKETSSSALVRFTVNIPENLRQEAASQGDLFKSVSTIKLILGTFDVANDFSLALDALMRTPSQPEAAELESGLKGLVTLVRGFLGGGDPKTDVFGQLLDQIKIGTKANDVSLSITVPRSLIDQFTKKSEPAEKKN